MLLLINRVVKIKQAKYLTTAKSIKESFIHISWFLKIQIEEIQLN